MSLSTSDEGTGLEWAGALGARGLFPTAGHLRDRRYLRMLTEIPRFHRRAHQLLDHDDDRGSGRPDPGRVPRPRPVHAVLPAPLRRAARRRRLVVRPRRRHRLPRGVPVHVPAPPRHARRLRLADLAHGRRRLAVVRRPGRGRHRGLRRQRPDGCAGHRGVGGGHLGDRPHGARRAGVRRRRRRHPSGAGAGAPRRSVAGAAQGPRRAPLRAEHRAAAHRHPAAAEGPPRLGVVELPAARRRPGLGAGDLRPDPPPAAAHPDALPGHPRRRAPRRPRDGHRPPRLRAPALQPHLGRRPRPARRGRHPPGAVRRRLPRLGVPRGRRALRPRGRRGARAPLVRDGRRATSSTGGERDAVRRRRSRTPGARRSAVPSGTARTSGSSTSTGSRSPDASDGCAAASTGATTSTVGAATIREGLDTFLAARPRRARRAGC